MERLDTTILNADTILHLHRYAIAMEYVEGKRVLDIASGEGYGTNLLSKFASFVYGVDIDNNAINLAQTKYNKDNIEFITGSTSEIPLKDNSIDIVVSFETIEHHDQHEKMLEEIRRVLRPEGLLIISTPDKHFYTEVNKHFNEFHVKELYKVEFVELINCYFKKFQILSQSYLNQSSILLNENTRSNVKFLSGDFLEIKLTSSNPDFLIAIASNSDFAKQGNSIFDGESIFAKRVIKPQVSRQVNNSYSYRVGHIILFPFKFVRNIWKKLNHKYLL